MSRRFVLFGAHESTRAIIVKENELSEFISLITIVDGQYVRQSRISHWQPYDLSRPLLEQIINLGYIKNDVLFPLNSSSLMEIPQGIGEFYPRIYRPFLSDKYGGSFFREDVVSRKLYRPSSFPEFIPENRQAILLSINQLTLLKNMLIEIFEHVYPSPGNFKSYGHSLKNLLLLCCIEVESQLQAVLVANEIKPKGRYYTTVDYVKLKDILQLDKYSVKFNYYTQIQSVEPFKNWTSTKPTESIAWYESYNKIKHDGDAAFSLSSLENVISAISAIAILMYAQFGKNIPYWKEEIGTFFEITDDCIWKIEDYIIPPLKGEEWRSQKIHLM